MGITIPGAACSCGARLHAVPSSDMEDWLWLDEDGQMFEDRYPAGYKEDPKGWWDRLARTNIAAYSDLTARYALGMTGWVHAHRPAQSDPFTDDVPLCCEMPMRLTPRGWVCRENRHGR